MASVQAKLERVMPANLRRRVTAVDETVTLELERGAPAANNAALKALSAAAQSSTRVHLRYRTAQKEQTERGFDAHGLAYRRGLWYAVGMCHLRGGLRSFRLDRVLRVEPLATRFSRPAGFDALGHLVQGIATLPRAWSVEILLATDLDTARREIYATGGLLEWTGEGVLFRAQADDLRSFALDLAKLPFPFEIRHPQALRDTLAAHARGLLSQAAGERG